jgi:mRNA interferase MazF
VLVPFPFTDQSGTRKRPALVISSDAYNQACPDRVLVRTTLQPPAVPLIGDYALKDGGWQAAGLAAPSIVRCGKIITVETSLIVRQLGVMPASAMIEIDQHIIAALGLGAVP